jgi:hypothetical protein
MGVQILLAVLVAFVVIGTWEVRRVGDKLEEKLESLEHLLATEFGKEKKYYEEKEESDRRFEEWKEETRGLGPVDTVPMPPYPSALVIVAENLGSIASSLARLVEAGERAAGTSRSTTPSAGQ